MSRLVEIARTYLGAPFAHRGRTARGLDCAGLWWLTYHDAGVVMPDVKRYGREPHKDGLMRTALAAMGDPVWTGRPGQVCPRDLLQPGDWVIVRFEVEPHHVALITDHRHHGLGVIHADGTPGVMRVVEHGLDERYQKMICAVFRRPV